MKKRPISSRTIARQIAQATDDKMALDLVILDLRKLAAFADYFVIASGNSTRQVGAITDFVVETMAKKGLKPIGIEGLHNAKWALIDYGNVVVHIFHQPIRDFYGLERLWGDAKKVKLVLRLKT